MAAPAVVTAVTARYSGAPDAIQQGVESLLLDPIHEVDEMGWPHAAPTR